MALDANTYGYRWDSSIVTQDRIKNGAARHASRSTSIWDEGREGQGAVGAGARQGRARAKPAWRRSRSAGRGEGLAEPYVTPDEPESSWKKPGPAAGPFQAQLGDGSVVTYYWYRFADQPALLNADLTDAEREAMQSAWRNSTGTGRGTATTCRRRRSANWRTSTRR